MATTRIIPMHKNKGKTILQSLSDRTEYVMNPDKTDERELVSAYECSPETVDVDFLISKQEYRNITGREIKHGRDVIAYQVRQSFYPGEITPEDANRLGYELAMEFTKGQHQFIVATHIDKAHIHNHIVFNSTTLDCTHKFNNYKDSAEILRDMSDKQCLENGYSVITEPSEKGKTYAEWNAEQSGTSWKEQLRKNILEQISECPDFEELLKRMEALGYEIKQGKHIAFRAPGQKRFTRMKSLGEDFTEAKVKDLILSQQEKEKKVQNAVEQKDASLYKQDIPYLIDIQKKITEGNGKGYENWAKRFNLKANAEALLLLQKQGITSLEQLDGIIEMKGSEFSQISNQMKQTEEKMRQIKKLKQAMMDYGRTREVYAAYKKNGKSEDYYEEHRAEIMIHLAAKKVFDESGLKTLPKMKTLNAQYEELSEIRKNQYEVYREKRADLQTWQAVKQNISSMLDNSEKQKRRGLDR